MEVEQLFCGVYNFFNITIHKFMFEILIYWHSSNVIAFSLHYCNARGPEDDYFH
jgi:hypothetical protein